VTAVNIHKLAISGSGRSPSLCPQLRTALQRRWSGAETGGRIRSGEHDGLLAAMLAWWWWRRR
jgi:hypothetical protein